MAIFNFLLQLNTYSDQKASNSPSLSNFKWVRDLTGIPVNHPVSQSLTVAISTTLAVLTGVNKKFLYVESDKPVTLVVNGNNIPLTPVVIGTSVYPGSFYLYGAVTSLSIINASGTDTPNVFVAHGE